MKNCPPGGVYDQLEGTFKRNPADAAGHQTAGGRTACQTHVVSHRRTGGCALHSRRPQRSWQRCCGCCLKRTSAPRVCRRWNQRAGAGRGAARALWSAPKDALLGLTGLGGGEHRSGSWRDAQQNGSLRAQISGLPVLNLRTAFPGTVGGGVYMNAGAYGGEMKQAACPDDRAFAWTARCAYFRATSRAFRLPHERI